MADLTDVLIRLQEERLRATYGAVAGYIGGNPLYLMQDRPRDPLHSWVVNKKTGDPTKYREDQKHPELYQNDRVLQTPSEVEEVVEPDGDSRSD
jgi:hypothetical protein